MIFVCKLHLLFTVVMFSYKSVGIENCSAPHYTVLLQLGEAGVHMNKFTFNNFVSLKLIFEGEIKENVTVDISNFRGVFGNVLGQVEIKGVVRCFNYSDMERQQRNILNINIDKVDTVTVSNFFIKDSDNSCDVNFLTHGARNFIVKESKFQKNITGDIRSDTCSRDKLEVPCHEVFIEHKRLDYTLTIVITIIGLFGVMSLTFIVTRASP